MKEFVLVFIGGGAGSALRYATQLACSRFTFQGTFPLPTFVANVAGCFLIGLFYALTQRLGWSADTRLLLTTGLCGGFTTFSTFCNESMSLLRGGSYGLFPVYILSSFAAGLAATWAGAACARQ